MKKKKKSQQLLRRNEDKFGIDYQKKDQQSKKIFVKGNVKEIYEYKAESMNHMNEILT